MHHIGCLADRIDSLDQLQGWSSLPPDVQALAQHAYDSSNEASSGVARAPADTSDSHATAADGRVADTGIAGAEAEHVLRHLDFWDRITWEELHDSEQTIRVVPEAVRPGITDYRQAICEAALSASDSSSAARALKALLFSDQLLSFLAEASRRLKRAKRRVSMQDACAAAKTSLGRSLGNLMGRI